MVYDELSNLGVFLCCQGVEQANSGQLAPWALRKAIVGDEDRWLWGWYLWVPINTFRSSQSGQDTPPWSMRNCITITPYCATIVCFYCLCFMTHFRLLIADTIIHDFYSFDDSWPLLGPTIDPFLLSIKPTFSNNIHFLYQHCSIFGSIVGFLQSFGWSVRNTYPKRSTIYSLIGTHCIP